MRCPAILQSLKARFGPSRWLGIAIFILLLIAWRFLEGESVFEQHLVHFIYIALGLGYLYAIAPVPWQWTANGRGMAPFLRGLIQSVFWNGSLLFIPLFLPVAFGNVITLFGRGEVAEFALHGYVTPLQLGWAIYSHAFWVACLVGWLIAREEDIQVARKEAEESRRTLEHATRQAQAQALQAQLDPHVLYNALSGISELIHEDTAKAEAAVVHLSGLYRKLTVLGKRERVGLGEERQILEDYLAVEQVRLGSRLQVSWEWPEALNDRRVPPLLVQPLVENAIKHGLSPEEKGGRLLVSVAVREGDLLHIHVANDGKPLDPAWREGTGLANLAARLALIGGGSRMELSQQGNLTVADLYVHSRRAT
jgi:sensor histidine kinase YesM